MSTGIQFEVIWNDREILEVRISASNNEFAGSVDLYTSTEQISKYASKLDGFPNTPSDTREIVLGAFGSEWAGGAAKMRFFCIGSSGHSYVEIQMESSRAIAGVIQSSLILVAAEAAAVDRFVHELRQLSPVASPTAHLGPAN